MMARPVRKPYGVWSNNHLVSNIRVPERRKVDSLEVTFFSVVHSELIQE